MENRRYSRKVDLKRFLNCKVVLDGNIQCTTFKGTNGSGLTIAQKHGKFTSDRVTVNEVALNNTVLRIHLIREDLKALKRSFRSILNHSPNRKRKREQTVSSFGRQIKRKSQFFDDAFVSTPFKKGGDYKIVENGKNSVSNSRQMKNEKENKNISTSSRLRSTFVSNAVEDSKTLNRAIKKNPGNKIKIKLFPRLSMPNRRAIKNDAIDLTSDKSKSHEEVFIKKYRKLPQWHISNKSYFLTFKPYRYPEDGTLDYSFQKLVTDVKHMKLPAPSWKIKVIIRQGKIAAITFTNKLALERSVAFSVNSDKYKIIIDNKPAFLLGSPKHIQTSEDLEILLNIVQNIEPKNPMVYYK